ncbi:MULTISPECIES: hypothetical protein [Burkholderia]|uniref:Uncharacterized protein n=1 Tax=Burkholderia cenocepacia TaxID=95486 RepID=A0A6B2MRV8_9BURK|nr:MULTISPECIES: hypothetical protein [Burkholderia]MEB2535967.1 hypothetical protein [Burkholderia anthinoferrum]MEB2565167.1 hypothetical protein [Burkholderia anthinoferrum]HDR9258538.1 hypothetical protein [Burkholderia vietnamiensis]MBR8348675.1 hypothetical protein [Burkholderia ambifaria]MCA8108599.1 hypothetical protein [Burkholderia sp. AU36459]
MTQLIQIAPGVLFSSDVLSPEWGRTRQRKNGSRMFILATIIPHRVAVLPRASLGELHTPRKLLLAALVQRRSN